MNCPWCGGNEINHDVAKTITSPYIVADIGGGKIPMATVSLFSECKCGLIFQEHRQDNDWYDWFYSSGTYRKTLGISQEEMDADEKQRAFDITNWLKERNITFQYHLDIGSSRGYFLNNTKWVFGCSIGSSEPNLEYSQLTAAPIKQHPDMVSAIHVLEHVTDPISEIKKWSDMTDKYLLIEVPGKNTIGGPLRFAHLYYFPPELIKEKMVELGFDVVSMETEPNTRILTIRK